MAEKVQQTVRNHARIDPAFHYVLAPALILLLGWEAARLFRAPSVNTAILAALTLLVLLTAFKARVYALKVQDRVIRLEERLRLSNCLAEPLRNRISELTEAQLIALRFASEAELPALVERTLGNSLDGKTIKQAVVNWRGDYWRV